MRMVVLPRGAAVRYRVLVLTRGRPAIALSTGLRTDSRCQRDGDVDRYAQVREDGERMERREREAVLTAQWAMRWCVRLLP